MTLKSNTSIFFKKNSYVNIYPWSSTGTYALLFDFYMTSYTALLFQDELTRDTYWYDAINKYFLGHFEKWYITV